MTFLIDSCVWVDVLRGKTPALADAIRHLRPVDIGVPAVVLAELRHGALRSANSERNLMLLGKLLDPYVVVPFDGACAEAYAEVRDRLEKRGKVIGSNDLLIAATALANDLTLVTNNLREFQRISDLRLEHWEALDF